MAVNSRDDGASNFNFVPKKISPRCCHYCFLNAIFYFDFTNSVVNIWTELIRQKWDLTSFMCQSFRVLKTRNGINDGSCFVEIWDGSFPPFFGTRSREYVTLSRQMIMRFIGKPKDPRLVSMPVVKPEHLMKCICNRWSSRQEFI